MKQKHMYVISFQLCVVRLFSYISRYVQRTSKIRQLLRYYIYVADITFVGL